MNDYKQECFKRLEYTQKYSKYNKEDLIEEIIEKDKQLDKYKNVIDKIKTYVNIYKEIKGYYDKKIYDEDLKENILEYIGEVDG